MLRQPKHDVEGRILDLPGLSRGIIEPSPLPMAAVEGKEHIVRHINPSFCRLVGKKGEELIGYPFPKAVPEAHGCISLLDRVSLTGKAEIYALEKQFGSSTISWSCAVWPVLAADEKPAGLIIQVTDMTEATLFRQKVAAMNEELLLANVRQHELMEEELRKANRILEVRVQERTGELKRQAELIELSHDAILVRDLENRVVFWSQGAEEVYGWTKEEALGKITHEFLKTQFPVRLADLNAELMGKGRWEGELVHTCKEGKKLDILSRQALQRDKDGRPSAILEINIDVTDRKRMEEQSRQAQRMEALGTLAGGIAHDFNNLLNSILLNTEVALLDLESKVLPSAESLRLTREAADRGKELVKQIIVFSRHKGQARSPIEISSVIKEALKLLKSTALKTVEIRTQMEPGNIVLADPIQIHQVIMNLCLNAAHAMGKKDGILEVTLAKVESYRDGAAAQPMGLKAGTYVHLTVKDNGHGMPRETLERAFDPFFTTKRKGEGSGMGLAVVHGIVKKHEGAIRLESEEGKGTIASIFLPVFQGEVKESVSSLPEEIPRGTERILFVDDEEAQVRSVQLMLERLGYRVTAEMDPRRALDRFRSQPDAFDLVITDQIMPYLPGNRLAQELLSVRGDIPIILCTGFSEVVDEDNARVMGIRDFILKPFRLMEITEMIRKVLIESRSQ